MSTTIKTAEQQFDQDYEAYVAQQYGLSPAPADNQGASVAAPAEAQGLGTITVQELQRWLDKRAAAARQAIQEDCDFFDRKCVHEPAIDYCRIASALIREFIQERAA